MIGGRHRIRVLCPGCMVTQRFWPSEVTFWVDPADDRRAQMRWSCPDLLCVCAGRVNVTLLDPVSRAGLAVMIGDGSVTPEILAGLPAHPENPDRAAGAFRVAEAQRFVDDLAELDRPGWEQHLTGDRG